MGKTIVGLEITEESLRAVEVSRGRKTALVAAGEVPLPPGTAKDSEVLDADVIAMAVHQLWGQAQLKSKEVIVGVANRRILVREHSTPAIRPDLMRAALPYDVQDLLPVPPEQAVLDFYPISQANGQVHGLLVAAVSETIESIITALNRARVKTAAVDFVPFGLARVAKKIAPPGETVAVVAIDEHTTNLVVAQDGIPRFARIIPLDLGFVTRGDKSMLPGETTAEELPAARRAVPVTTAEAASPPVTDLVGRIRNTLSFHASRPEAVPVSTVFLTGPGIDAPGLLQLASAHLQAQVFTIDVTTVIPLGRSAPALGGLSHSLITTLGVLLGEER